MAGEHYASGNWLVKAGSEDEFIARWRDWIGKSTSGAAGFVSARLTRNVGDARRFLSFSEWDTAETRDAWKSSPDFAEGFATCRELCDDFTSGDYMEAVRI